MSILNTESEFFKGKRPWSKIKDAVLRDENNESILDENDEIIMVEI